MPKSLILTQPHLFNALYGYCWCVHCARFLFLSQLFANFVVSNDVKANLMVIFDEYKPGGHQINPALLWECDMATFDWKRSKVLVAQRVVERGSPDDFYAAFDKYGGVDGFREIVKEIPYLNAIDIHFVCTFFNLRKEELKCCTKKLLTPKHWNS